jgi:hypothetical protein
MQFADIYIVCYAVLQELLVSTSKNLSLIGSFSVLKIGGQILISIDGEM